MNQGIQIVIDGIDGSGKSTILNFWKEYLEEQKKSIFQMRPYWQEHHRHPEITELKPFDVIFTAEPTFVGVGAAIRQELIRSGSDYSALTIANAYALDRFIAYKKMIVPLLTMGKIILQDRSVSTSLCYQSVQDHGLPMETIAKLEGNAFALDHAPAHLVIADVSVETAFQRIGSRFDKLDNAIFEKQSFLIKSRERFLDPTYQSYFTNHGTTIHILNSEAELGIMKQRSIDLLKKLLPIATNLKNNF